MPSVNTQTGIPYGIVNGNSVPYLLDDIFSSGESTTFAAYKADLIDSIRQALRQIADDNGAGSERQQRIADACNPEEIAEAMLDGGLNDRLEFDEEDHEHSEKTEFGEVHYLQGWLGGATLIWVTESPFVAYAPHCSPCVPGAGDLDDLCDEENGSLCYCCPPDCFRGDNDEETHSIVGSVEIDGKIYQIVGKVAEPAELQNNAGINAYPTVRGNDIG